CQLIPLTDLLPLVDDPEKFEREMRSLDVPASEVRHPALFGPLGRSRPLAGHEHAFLRTLTDKPVKIALPGPYLLTRLMWLECVSDRVYRSREHLAEDVVRVLRATTGRWSRYCPRSTSARCSSSSARRAPASWTSSPICPATSAWASASSTRSTSASSRSSRSPIARAAPSSSSARTACCSRPIAASRPSPTIRSPRLKSPRPSCGPSSKPPSSCGAGDPPTTDCLGSREPLGSRESERSDHGHRLPASDAGPRRHARCARHLCPPGRSARDGLSVGERPRRLPLHVLRLPRREVSASSGEAIPRARHP